MRSSLGKESGLVFLDHKASVRKVVRNELAGRELRVSPVSVDLFTQLRPCNGK